MPHLVRPALLYADKVVLHSVAAQMIIAVGAMPAASANPGLDLLLALEDETVRHLGADPAQLQLVRDAQQRGGREAAVVDAMLQAGLAGPNEELRKASETILDDAGWGELAPAVDAGLLEIPLPSNATDWSIDALIDRFADELERLLTEPRTLPLFDESTASLVRAGIDEGRFNVPTAVGPIASGAAGSGFLTMLPSFGMATTAEILDIRTEVGRPLIAYRRAIATLARDMRSRPWDAEFGAELEERWRTDVQPALDELAERFSEATFLRQLGPRLTKPADLLRDGAIAFVASSLATRAQLAHDLAAAGVAVAGAALGAARAAHDERAAAEGSGFWLLHHVEDRLGTNRAPSA